MEILTDNVQHPQKGTSDAQEKRWLSLVPFLMLVSDCKSSIITPYRHSLAKALLTNLKSYNKIS